MVPGTPSSPPAPVVAEGLPGAKVVSVGGSGADFAHHTSASALAHQLVAGTGGAFVSSAALNHRPGAVGANEKLRAETLRIADDGGLDADAILLPHDFAHVQSFKQSGAVRDRILDQQVVEPFAVQ